MPAAFLITTLLAAPNLMLNPGFDNGLDNWVFNASSIPVACEELQGRPCAVVRVDADVEPRYYGMTQSAAAIPGAFYELAFDGLGDGISGGYGVYAALEYIAVDGSRIGYAQSDPIALEGEWRRVTVRGRAPENAAGLRVALLLNGHGIARFDDVTLTQLDHDPLDPGPIDGPVTLTVAPQPLPVTFLGVGAEDDGWFYNRENADRGVTAEDYALREARIAWMDPDITRMFFWYRDWCPSGDWETFTWDSDNMESHYRTLDLYQRLGASVVVCGVEWGIPDVFNNAEGLARAWGELMEELIRRRGYTCIRYWTLTNEPNSYWFRQGRTFDQYVHIHERIAGELQRRDLPVHVMGSDDTAGLQWFAFCARDPRYRAVSDLLVSHRYFQYLDQYKAASFYDDRLRLIGDTPFAVMEFGFLDDRSSALTNPIMETYPYALWALDFACEGLNRGTTALSIWCMHEVHYPGNGFMNFGLWEFNDDWRVRPVYHAWAALTRRTEPGQPMYPVQSSHPDHVNAARVGDTLFWLNHSNGPADVHIHGWVPQHVRIMDEPSLAGDRLCGVLRPTEDGAFLAPARSFGYAFVGTE